VAAYNGNAPFPTPSVKDGGDEELTNEAAGEEEPVHGTHQVSTVAPCQKVKVFEEGWLAQRGCDNSGSIAKTERANGHEKENAHGVRRNRLLLECRHFAKEMLN
jgi:hypothetical protein